MARFKINESGKVYELSVVNYDTNEDCTGDIFGILESEEGVCSTRLGTDEAFEEGYDYRIAGGAFEFALEYLEEHLEQPLTLIEDYR